MACASVRAEIGNTADRDQRGESADRKPEYADAAGVQPCVIWPFGKHVVDQPVHMLRPVHDVDSPALVLMGVAGVADGDRDETSLRERQRRVIVVLVVAAIAMGHDDQRQMLARHRRARGDGLNVGAERMVLGRRGGRVPDPDDQRLLLPIGNS